MLAYSAVASAEEPVLSDLREIRLKSGMNHIEQFSDDGRPADILVAWHDTGTAGSYNIYVVTMLNGPGSSARQVVSFEADDEPDLDVMRDAPHTFEDMVTSVRFVRGMVDGTPATLLILANRQVSFARGIPEPAPVTFKVYQFIAGREDLSTSDSFKRIIGERAEGQFCNADYAIKRRFGLEIPAGHQAGTAATGCP